MTRMEGSNECMRSDRNSQSPIDRILFSLDEKLVRFGEVSISKPTASVCRQGAWMNGC